MPNITVKSIPSELYDRLKQSATENRRSVNQEIIVCLERTLLTKKPDSAALLARVDDLRERANLPPLTDEILRKVKSDGRP
ncbi:MAG: hypothetical protein AMXMBFR82_47790 [Candidatus Hydrogenedentota bacterium]